MFAQLLPPKAGCPGDRFCDNFPLFEQEKLISVILFQTVSLLRNVFDMVLPVQDAVRFPILHRRGCVLLDAPFVLKAVGPQLQPCDPECANSSQNFTVSILKLSISTAYILSLHPSFLLGHFDTRLITLAMSKPQSPASISEAVVEPQSQHSNFMDLGDPFLDDYHTSRFNPYPPGAE
jgi:hypothetical protein